jgi:hypothetical protein
MFEWQVALQYSFWRNYFFKIQKVVCSRHLELRQNKVLTSYCFLPGNHHVAETDSTA